MVDFASMAIIGTAFVFGLVHSLDPDHIVAVSALICNERSLRRSIFSATAWGGGHAVVLFVVGLLLLGLKVAIPESIVQLFELAAGTMLVIIGALVLRPVVKRTLVRRRRRNEPGDPGSVETTGIHSHLHRHGHDHSHTHSHQEDGHHHIHKSAVTGVLQGLGGSAAVMLVTLTTVTSIELGFVFIAVFGVGVVLGMVSIACMINSLMNFTAGKLEGIGEKISAATGMISIGFGLFVIIQVLLVYHF